MAGAAPDAHSQDGPRAILPPVSAALRWRTVGVLGGLALVLAVASGIWQREQLLGSGRVVILELAPVDPRSLMQGDYMALTFAAGADARGPSGPDPGRGTQL